MKVLLVQAEGRLRAQLTAYLTRGLQAEVVEVNTRGAVMEQIGDRNIVAIVDPDELPYELGVKLVSDLREAGHQTPILILSEKDAWADKVTGLDAGADDYLSKPFQLEELTARLRALARRR